MIKVYFDYGCTTDLVAVFIDEEMYNACLPGLEHQALINKAKLVESITDKNISDYEFSKKSK